MQTGMKRFFASLLCAVLLGSAQAEDASKIVTPATPTEAQPVLEVPVQRMGYAFEQPEILIRQRLFGLAHGLSLLAAACLDLPAYSGPIQDAYAAWHAKQAKTIEAIVHDLARYYFASRADEARWPDLSRAMNLSDRIETALSEVTLHAACASLPEAIGRPRYELDRMLVEGIDPGTREAVAAPPAPTPAKPAE
jgi:hypothetical protein